MGFWSKLGRRNVKPATIGPAVAERGGDPVLGTDGEEQCAAIIAAIVDETDLDPYLSKLLIIGPGFAHAMSGDQAKFPYGKAMLMQGVYGGQQMFFIGRAAQGDEQTTMLKAGYVRDFLRRFKGAEARPATRDERGVYYSVIAWEIEGRPVTVMQDGERRLLLHNTEEGKLFWIDMIEQYPVPSVAENFERAIELISTITMVSDPSGEMWPNTRMNLTTQSVTARACARPAPGRLAGYAQR